MDPDSLFRLFRRALRACQFYPSDGPVRLDIVGETHYAFSQAGAASADGLSFSFLEEGAYVDGRPVRSSGEGAGEPHPKEEGSASLARQIYALGLRELRFLPGLTVEELARLLDPLARALLGFLNPVDEDLSVLLWEADLRCVGYQLYEEETTVDPVPEAAETEASVRPSFDEYVDSELVIGGSEAPELLARLGEQEKLRLLASYRREEEGEVPVKYARLVLELLRGETDPAASTRITQALIEFLSTVANLGRFSLLERIKGSLSPSAAGSALEAAALENVAAWFQSPAFVHSLVDVSPPELGADRAAADRLLFALPAPLVPDLVARGLETGGDRALARLVVDCGARVMCLRDARPRVKEAAVEASLTDGCVRGPDDSEEVLLLTGFLQDARVALRKKAVEALARCPAPSARSALVQALRDTEEAIRTAAAEALARRGERAALEPLLRVLLSRDFERRSRSEQRAFFMAAGRVAPGEVCPVLARTAERRIWFAGRWQREKQDAALEALSALGPEARAFVLRRWKGRRADLLRRMEAA